MDGILTKRCEYRTKVVEDLARNWKQEHDDAMLAWDAQDLVKECLEHQELLRHDLWESSLQRAIEGQIDDLERHGQFLLSIFDRSIAVFENIEEFVKKITTAGHSIDRKNEFHRGVIETRKLRRRIQARWPIADPDSMNRAMENYRNGKKRNARDILNDLHRRSA